MFQQRMSDLIQWLDNVKVYQDDLLVLTKGYCSQHLLSLDKFIKKYGKRLGVNMNKSYISLKVHWLQMKLAHYLSS